MGLIELIPITAHNIELAIAIARLIFPYEQHDDGFYPADAYRAAIAANDPTLMYYLAIRNQQPVGITGHYKEETDEDEDAIWLGWFGVLEQCRGRGFGEKILKQTQAMVSELGFKTLRLWSSNRREQFQAHYFYAKHGFTLYNQDESTLCFEKTLPLETIYLAGPMRGYPLYNFPKFDATAQQLRDAGYDVISPAELDRASGFDEHSKAQPDIGAAILRDVRAIVKNCKTIALLPGWERSKGCAVEVALGKLLGLRFIDAITMKKLSL